MLADYHVHTEFSDDSTYAMEDVVQDAIRLGLNELCFTDHVDYGVKRDWDDPAGLQRRDASGGNRLLSNVDYPRYAARIQELRRIYGDRIQLKLGLEFGMQVHTIPKYESLFLRYPFDFILLSVHQVENQEFWRQEFQHGRTQREYNERYYQEILALVQRYQHYSVLAHMDAIVRYDEAGRYPFEALKPLLEKILRLVIANGKGLEVNTSSQRFALDDLTPSRDILRLYRELGGTILTIGSDSHRKGDLGSGIRETKEELLQLGFERYCTFRHMTPIWHELRE